MNFDFNSASLPSGISYENVNNVIADAERNWFVRLFTGTSEADKQDFNRAEKSADNQFYRDLALQENANAFSHDEAQLNRDWQERMSNTSYQRAVADMKVAGINPVLVLPQQGGATTPSGGVAQASSAHSSGNYSHTTKDDSAAVVSAFLNATAKVISGLLGGD